MEDHDVCFKLRQVHRGFVMKDFILWLEGDNKRLRKVLAIFTALVWLIAVIISYIGSLYKVTTIEVLGAVTAQFSIVISAYMMTKAESD